MLTRRTPTRTRTARRPGDLRTAILREARRLYLAHGSDAVTARAIAQRVGVSPTALYLHFRSLDDIYQALRLEGHERLAGYLRDAAAGRAPAEAVRAMGRAYYRFGVEHRGYFDLMFHDRTGAARSREAVQREMFTLLLLRDVVAAGLAGGAFRRDVDPMVATNALWAKIHGVTALMVAGLLVETAAGHADAVVEAVLDAALHWLAEQR